MVLFPFETYYWVYFSFSALVILLLLLDLGVFHRTPKEVSMKAAAGWSVFWVSFGLILNGSFYLYLRELFPENPILAKQLSLEFLTGFVIEKTLAIDNIFVFVMVFSALKIPARLQHRVLFLGLMGAIVFRAIFIALGAELMNYVWVTYVFGGILVLSGMKMLFFNRDEGLDLKQSKAFKALVKVIPFSDELDGTRMFVRKSGRWFGTPFLLALLLIEFSDIIFAIDSVPAIFAVTREPLVVFMSNILAVLGMRSLYFLLGGLVNRFYYLKTGLAFVIIFVGLKMTLLHRFFGGHFPIHYSLIVIVGMILASVIASVLRQYRLRLSLKRIYLKLSRMGKLHSDRSIATGVGVGLFFGVMPVFGLQIALSVVFSMMLRGHHGIAAAMTWVSNPFTSVPLYTFCYWLGHQFVPGPEVATFLQGNDIHWERVWSIGHDFFFTLILGSTAVGLVLGLAGYLFCRATLRE